MKGIPIEHCISKARDLITKQGIYLLLLDTKDSAKSPDRKKLQIQLIQIKDSLNQRFAKYLSKNSLEVLCETHQGFRIVGGDSLVAGINSEQAIHEIEAYLRNYPIQFHWQVAKDGYSQEIRLIK